MDQDHGEATCLQVGKIFINQPIRKNQQTISVMRPYWGRQCIADICMIGGYNQVILFLAYNRFDTIQKRDEEIIMKVVEQKTNHASLAGGQIPSCRMRHVPKL